jgi:hypothetical protein
MVFYLPIGLIIRHFFLDDKGYDKRKTTDGWSAEKIGYCMKEMIPAKIAAMIGKPMMVNTHFTINAF